jgi:RNA polymerase sigma-70 factor (ECF subfamily)
MARDEARKAAREKRHLTLLKSEPDAAPSTPEDDIDADTQRTRVRAALDQLTPRDREALLLWDAGMSYDEIAAQTGLSRGAIGTTLARARRRLVEAYDAGLEGGQHVARG